MKKFIEALAMYLDDLLFLCGCICFVIAADEIAGRPAALATAGICFIVMAIFVAKAKGGGR